MANTKPNKAFWWLIFVVSVGLMAYGIMNHWSFLILILPFLCTSLVKALDII